MWTVYCLSHVKPQRMYVKTAKSVSSRRKDLRRNKTYINNTNITRINTTFAEMHQKIIDASNEFNALPLEIRSEYEFDVSKFIADIGSEHWFNLMNPVKKDTVSETVEKSEVTSVE